MKIKLTAIEAEEVEHKLEILVDTEDLQVDYNLSLEQAEALLDSVPSKGGEWTIPDFGLEAVKGELEDAGKILRDGIAESARDAGEIGQALSACKLAKRLEEKASLIGEWLEKTKGLKTGDRVLTSNSFGVSYIGTVDRISEREISGRKVVYIHVKDKAGEVIGRNVRDVRKLEGVQ